MSQMRFAWLAKSLRLHRSSRLSLKRSRAAEIHRGRKLHETTRPWRASNTHFYVRDRFRSETLIDYGVALPI